MPYNSRDPNAGTVAGWQLSVPRGLAAALILALLILWALRHVYGTISVSAGAN